MPATPRIPASTRGRADYVSDFHLRDCVHMDDDTSIVCRVTGLMWTSDEGHKVQVSWMHNGQVYSTWMEYWRLTAA